MSAEYRDGYGYRLKIADHDGKPWVWQWLETDVAKQEWGWVPVRKATDSDHWKARTMSVAPRQVRAERGR